jgi:DNA (cytosine-5)-methyltransferase 1
VNVTDTSSIGGLQSIKNLQPEQPSRIGPISDGREWDVTNSSDKGLQRGELIRTLKGGEWKQNDSRESATKLYKIENWQQFPTESPVCGGDDGLSRELDGITFSKWRAESIKAYGNAIVPQVAYQIFQAIQNTHDN